MQPSGFCRGRLLPLASCCITLLSLSLYRSCWEISSSRCHRLGLLRVSSVVRREGWLISNQISRSPWSRHSRFRGLFLHTIDFTYNIESGEQRGLVQKSSSKSFSRTRVILLRSVAAAIKPSSSFPLLFFPPFLYSPLLRPYSPRPCPLSPPLTSSGLPLPRHPLDRW